MGTNGKNGKRLLVSISHAAGYLVEVALQQKKCRQWTHCHDCDFVLVRSGRPDMLGGNERKQVVTEVKAMLGRVREQHPKIPVMYLRAASVHEAIFFDECGVSAEN